MVFSVPNVTALRKVARKKGVGGKETGQATVGNALGGAGSYLIFVVGVEEPSGKG